MILKETKFGAMVAALIALSPSWAGAFPDEEAKAFDHFDECISAQSDENNHDLGVTPGDDHEFAQRELTDFPLIDLAACETQSFARAASSGGC